MEKSMKRENILLEYSSQIAARNSPQTPHRSSETDDMDFNDVFGGPPRRFSMQEARVKYSYGETVESEEEISQWALLKEKPVFGDEIVARRRRQGNDFYDDIFGGDEPQNSPRKTDRDKDSVFGSNPSSRIMSPARSFTPKPEPSLPAQFSLPSKLTKAVDHPVFGSRNNNSSGLKSPHSPSNSSSRFSNQASRSQNQIRNELHQSVLSREASLSSEEDSPFYEKGKTEKLKKETKIMDQFHFSIYKWAGSGVPMLVMPLMGRNNLKPKDSSGNYDKEIDHVESESITVTRQGFSAEFEKKDLKIKEVVKEVQNSKGAVHKIPESKSESKAKNTVGLVEATKILKSKKLKSVDEVVAKEKVYGEKPETVKDFLKSEEVGKIVTKERTIGTANGAYSSDHSIKNVEKHAGPGIDSERQNVGKPNLQDGRTSSGTSTNKSGIKGKVKGFVQIFNQEGDSKPKVDFQELSQSFRSKTVGIGQKESEVSSNAANVEESLNLHNVNKKPDVSPKVDENVKDKAQQYSSRNSTSNRYNDFPTKQKNNAVTPEPLNRNSGILVDYPDDASEDNFLVEELFDDLDKHTQSGAEVSDDMKALDAKIQQWSVGKKGNIRSLLSTLQYVLWAESGWTAVPLVDLIEGNSVKRAYQKALLRLHPDKLQQKGAADSHKYIAQKVFDILQEAWDHFNTLAPL